MKKFTTIINSFAAITAVSLAFTACKVEQTEEGEMPSVDVDVKEGNMPEFDVDAAEVQVGMEEKEVSVPKVKMEEETIKLPDVDVTMPDDKKIDTPGEQE